ncbi:MAG: cation:proton antiporter [Actinomycetia bacterium]|nr:cation:proton antiporter [Actinomycetes bacterium]
MTVAEVNVRLLLTVAVVIVAVRAVGWLVARAGQPYVIGEIAAGVLLGPSLLGLVAPEVSGYLFPDLVVDGLRLLAQFGIVLFLFLIGLHLDLPSLRGSGRTVTVVAHASIIVPFALAAGLAALAHPTFGAGTGRVAFSVFLGSAMAVTALPVLARLLAETGLATNRLGVIALACAAVNDVVAWCLVALVAASTNSSRPSGALITIALALVFLAVMVLIVRPLLARLPNLPVWVVLVTALGCAWLGEQIGVHAIIGAFTAGAVMPRRRGWQDRVRGDLDVVVRTLLLPAFFVVAGLATRVDTLTGPAWLLLAVAVAVAVAGKLGAVALAARLAGETWRDATTLGILMNTRGLTELVILSLGLQLGVIDITVYTVMVLVALITTFMAAPLLTVVCGRRADRDASDVRADQSDRSSSGLRTISTDR